MKDAAAAYLTLRRAAGFEMANAEYLLGSFVRFPAERNEIHIHRQTAIDWAAQGASSARRDERLKTVCQFMRHVRSEDDRHELPPANYFGYRKTRRMPYIYSSNEIGCLLQAASRLGPRGTMRAQTYAALIALLACTGLRISEALGLRFSDITDDGLLIRGTKLPYLVREEVQALLDAPDPATREGIRDRAMLHLAVCAGLRVSELTGLRTGDVTLPSMSIRVLGKGRRERVLPLWKTTASALRAWLAIRGAVVAPEVFISHRGEPLSRWGFAYVLKQHVETAGQLCPGLQNKHVSPHVLRHTCAMIVLQATQDIRKVSLWFGTCHSGKHRNLHARRSHRKAPSDRGDCAATPAQRLLPAARQADRLAPGYRGNGEQNGPRTISDWREPLLILHY
jgi:site-specific recombinase XerD